MNVSKRHLRIFRKAVAMECGSREAKISVPDKGNRDAHRCEDEPQARR
jgi:hypothetical protein